MKKIIVFILIGLFPVAAIAQVPIKIKKKISPAPVKSEQQRPVFSSKQAINEKALMAQIKRHPIADIAKYSFADAADALIRLQQPKNWKEISWEEFLKQNQYTKEVEICSSNIDLKFCQKTNDLLKGSKLPIAKGQGAFDYTTITNNQKLIFIGEMHNTTDIIPEVIAILTGVRKNHPNARILLATEFLNWAPLFALTELESARKNYNDSLPLFDFIKMSQAEGKELTEQEKSFLQYMEEAETWIQQATACTDELFLLKKANMPAKHLYVFEEHTPVLQAADQLNIDQLALDDMIVLDSPRVLKLGNSIIRNAEKATAAKNTTDLWYLVSSTPWGVRERNREWARRIKPLLPLYDIVIVYSGWGHTQNTYSLALPPMIGIKDYTSITFISSSVASKEMDSWVTNKAKEFEREGYTHDEQIDKMEYEQVESLTSLYLSAKDIWKAWKDPENQPFWILSTPDQSSQTYQQMRNMSGDKSTEDFIKLSKELFPVNPKNELTILLPLK